MTTNKIKKEVDYPKKVSDFNLEDKEGVKHSLKSLGSKLSVVFFYPKDNTPGCSIEAQSFKENLGKFRSLGVQVIGISGGNAKSKQKFCETKSLEGLLLLSDSDFSVSQDFAVYGEKQFMGRKFMGINRVTFVLDKNRTVLKVFDKVTPSEHVQEVLEFLEGVI